MLRSAAQRAAAALRQTAQQSLLASVHQHPLGSAWLPGCTSRTSCVAPAAVLQSFHTVSFALQEAQPEMKEARGETQQAPADTKVGKNANDPNKPETFDQGHIEPDQQEKNTKGYMLSQPTYSKDYMESIAPKHKQPSKLFQTTGLYAVTALRWSFDKVTRYGPEMNEAKWMTRILFLETIAGVPGMVGAMLRHLRSLRSFKRDHGWIHTLLEEAENERMHLLTFLALKQPNFFFRAAVLGAQGVFFNLYTLFYMISPRHCHAFVGYLEEEAVKTYTHCLADIDSGKLDVWKHKKAPEIAIEYWKLDKNASLRDVILAVRADEACHSHVNHTFSEMKALEDNPFSGENSHVIP